MKKIFYTILILSILTNANSLSIVSQKESVIDWRLQYTLSHSKAISAKVSTNRGDLNASSTFAPNSELSTALLFLVDSSTPMKKAYKDGIQPTIKKLFSQKNPWDFWALAQFDEKLVLRGDFNQTNINESLKKVEIKGRETELFRFAIDAIKMLKERKESRKFLVLFTDGMAEDQGYVFDDVIKEARQNNITILSFGYKKTSVAIGNLRRLASDTGGRLWIADERTAKLEENSYQEFNQSINSGGEIKFKKSQLHPNEQGKEIITLSVKLEDNSSIKTQITIPVEKLIIEEESSSKLWLLLLAVIFLLFLLFFLLKPKKNPPEEPKEEIGKKKEVLEPIAYFETVTGSKLYAYKAYSSIGALAENDIVIDGEYISRRHAALEFKDLKFYIIDTNSINGTKVNYKEIKNMMIVDGDTISFGEYDVIFKVYKPKTLEEISND